MGDAPPTPSEPGPLEPVPERRLRNDVLIMFGSKLVVLVGGVAASIVIARELGADGRGLLAVAINFMLILTQIGTLGMQTTNPYFYGRHRIARPDLISNALWLTASVGSLLVLSAIVIKAVAPEVISGLDWIELLMSAAVVPSMLVPMYIQNLLLVDGRTIAYNLIEATSSAATVAALIVAGALDWLTLKSAIGITVGGYTMAALLCLFSLRAHVAVRRPDVALARRMVGYAGRIYAISLLTYAVLRIDTLLVNGFLGASQAGYYTLAVGLLDMVYLLPVIVSQNLLPRLLRDRASTETTAELFRGVAPFFALAVLLVAVFAEPAVRLLYGAEFAEPTAELFWWLVPAAWCLGMQSLLSAHLAARGAPAELVVIWLVGLVFNVAMNVALLPVAGAYIAPLASSLTYALVLAGHMRLFTKETGTWSALVPRPRELVRMVRTALSPAEPSPRG